MRFASDTIKAIVLCNFLIETCRQNGNGFLFREDIWKGFEVGGYVCISVISVAGFVMQW